MYKNYIRQYELLHEQKPHYGMTSIKFCSDIIDIIKDRNFTDVLDYGCGKSELLDNVKKKINIEIYKYDPAIKEYSELPSNPVDFVICTDVLQHIPVYDLDRVLKEIKGYSNNCFFHIRCTQYHTRLPNGQFANCTVFQSDWWMKKLSQYFSDIKLVSTNDINTVTFLTGKCI